MIMNQCKCRTSDQFIERCMRPFQPKAFHFNLEIYKTSIACNERKNEDVSTYQIDQFFTSTSATATQRTVAMAEYFNEKLLSCKSGSMADNRINCTVLNIIPFLGNLRYEYEYEYEYPSLTLQMTVLTDVYLSHSPQ